MLTPYNVRAVNAEDTQYRLMETLSSACSFLFEHVQNIFGRLSDFKMLIFRIIDSKD